MAAATQLSSSASVVKDEKKSNQTVATALSRVLWSACTCDKCTCEIGIAFFVSPCSLTVCFGCANSTVGKCPKSGCKLPWAHHSRAACDAVTRLATLARLQSGKTELFDAVRVTLQGPKISAVCATTRLGVQQAVLTQMILESARSNLAKYRSLQPGCAVLSLEHVLEGPMAETYLTLIRKSPPLWSALYEHMKSRNCDIKENLPIAS